MIESEKIINAIDEFLDIKHQRTTTPVEINPYLHGKGLLKDSVSRPGKPIREMLRKGKIPHAFQKGVNWFIPHSRDSKKNPDIIRNSETDNEIKQVNVISYSADGHKLTQIGELIVNLIVNKYSKKPSCFYEYKPEWLLSNPTEQLIRKYFKLSELYSELTNNELSLLKGVSELTDKKLKQKQSFDIWIGEPFNFAVEFDEKQHFNQYRKITLKYYDEIDIKFPLQFYKELNDKITFKPGKSGFTRLKSKDPLFPAFDEGEMQDNRIRQRAFRDYLKDLLPIENGCNPTLRIPYQVTNKRIANFSEAELKKIEEYIIDNDLI
jgi:hypothetical protein